MAAALLAIKGVASFATAAEILVTGTAQATDPEGLSIVAAVLAGVVLVIRARGLYMLRRSAWLPTLLLVVISVATAGWQILFGARTPVVWADLAVTLAAALYFSPGCATSSRPATVAFEVDLWNWEDGCARGGRRPAGLLPPRGKT